MNTCIKYKFRLVQDQLKIISMFSYIDCDFFKRKGGSFFMRCTYAHI